MSPKTINPTKVEKEETGFGDGEEAKEEKIENEIGSGWFDRGKALHCLFLSCESLSSYGPNAKKQTCERGSKRNLNELLHWLNATDT